MARQSQHLKQKQQISHTQIQNAQLLEISIIDLEQKVYEELEKNPALEEIILEKDNETENIENAEIDYSKPDSDSALQGNQNNNYLYISKESGWREMLIEEVVFHFKDEIQLFLAKFLIQNFDDKGILQESLQELKIGLEFNNNVHTNITELEDILIKIQNIDSTGVGTRDIQECLLIQIKKTLQVNPNSIIMLLSLKIVQEYYNLWIEKKNNQILQHLEIDNETLFQINQFLSSLNVFPVSSQDSKTFAIMPDFILTKENEKLQLSLNSKRSIKVHVNPEYIKLLTTISKNDTKGTEFIRSKINSAEQFISGLEERESTLLLVMTEIFKVQYQFFKTDDYKMLKPLLANDVANSIKRDPSTVSRAVNSKYIQSPNGTFPLSFFFQKPIKLINGQIIPYLFLKDNIQEIIDSENKKMPFSDEKLRQILSKEGYDIGRRQVRNIRDDLGIPNSKLRRSQNDQE